MFRIRIKKGASINYFSTNGIEGFIICIFYYRQFYSLEIDNTLVCCLFYCRYQIKYYMNYSVSACKMKECILIAACFMIRNYRKSAAAR